MQKAGMPTALFRLHTDMNFVLACPWRNIIAVEYATLEWVDCFNNPVCWSLQATFRRWSLKWRITARWKSLLKSIWLKIVVLCAQYHFHLFFIILDVPDKMFAPGKGNDSHLISRQLAVCFFQKIPDAMKVIQ